MEPSSALFVWAVFGFFGYFLPALVALMRKHRQTTAIMALNLLLGWTFIGWVAALIWALTNVTPGHSNKGQTKPDAEPYREI